MPCMLDYFPWEILHTIFDFLETIDVLHAFVDINPHLNTIFHSYSRMKLNFKSIKKSTFYFICENIYPNQIQSLHLSDDEYTLGQTKLFMSLLPLIQFTNLQYLSIDQISDIDLLCTMLSHLENHIQIHSLSMTSSHIQISKRKSRYITGILATLPSLKHLTVMDCSTLITLRQPLLKLTHLTIDSCTFDNLRIIFHWIPNLVHLQISVPYNVHRLTFDYVPPYLSSLIIKSKSWTLFDELENFFSLTPSLQHLVIETMGEQALLDGRRWEKLIKTKLPYLIELALNITPEENNMTGDDVLIPFQNSFWTEKHWNMACFISSMNNSCARLFSIPHFAPKDNWYPQGQGFFNYSLTPFVFDLNGTELRISYFPLEPLISSPFQHIKILSIQCTLDHIEQLQKVMNLLTINHLKFQGSVQCSAFDDILQVGRNIDQLTIKQKTLLEILDSLIDNQHVYEQIKKLHVEDILSSGNIDQICQIFPKLDHVSLFVKEQEDILHIFNGLHCLTSASVRWTHPLKTLSSVMDECLEQNNICTDGSYWFHMNSLIVWID